MFANGQLPMTPEVDDDDDDDIDDVKGRRELTISNDCSGEISNRKEESEYCSSKEHYEHTSLELHAPVQLMQEDCL